jgi:hypothetical protein
MLLLAVRGRRVNIPLVISPIKLIESAVAELVVYQTAGEGNDGKLLDLKVPGNFPIALNRQDF